MSTVTTFNASEGVQEANDRTIANISQMCIVHSRISLQIRDNDAADTT